MTLSVLHGPNVKKLKYWKIKFIERGCEENIVKDKMENVDNTKQKWLLRKNERTNLQSVS